MMTLIKEQCSHLKTMGKNYSLPFSQVKHILAEKLLASQKRTTSPTNTKAALKYTIQHLCHLFL